MTLLNLWKSCPRSTNRRGNPSRLLLLLSLAMFTASLHAQFNSALEGTVMDQTGAAVPGATVTLENLATGVTQASPSSSAGYYRFNALAASAYKLTISAVGFETVVETGIQLEVAKVTTINVSLPVGAARQEVRVSSAPPQIQTAEASVGAQISQDDVHDLPLIGRNFYTLVVLTPGVTGLPSGGGQAYAQASADIFNGEYGVNMNANGLRAEQNGFTVDGIGITSMVRGGVANLNPNADSVQELRVSVNTFTAESGGAGAHVDVITKGGTNKFHGNADWFTTNNGLQSKNEFQTTVPTFSRNEYAGALGGPIRRDHSFFFGTVDVLRSSVAFAAPSTVETPDFVTWMKANVPNNVSTSILSQYPSAIKSFTTTQTAGALNSVDCTTLATPSTPIETQAGLVPCNLDVLGTGLLNVTTPRNGLQWGIRGDQVFNQSRDRLDLSVYRTSVQQVSGSPSPYYPYFTTTEPESTLNGHINETHIFSPRFLNDAVASYVRLNGKIPCTQCNVPFIPAVIGTSSGIGDVGPIYFIQNNFEYRDNFSWDRGAHNIKIGGDLLKLQSNFNPIGFDTRPIFVFFSAFALAADQPFQETNFNFNPVTGSRNIPAVAERQPMVGLFVQDTWKLRSNLTMNLGLRWETFGKVKEATEVTNIVFQGGSTFVDQITNAKVDIVPSILKKQRYDNFSPRISMAWDPTHTGKSSLRLGFGKFFDPYTAQVYGGSHFNPPIAASGVATIFDPAGPQPLFALGASTNEPFDFPYPANLQLGLDAKNGLIGSRVAITATDPNLKTAYSLNWFLGGQYSLPHGWVVEADYIGSEGHHLYELYDVNRFAGDLIQNNGVLTRFNQSFGSISYAQGDLNSFYTGMSLSARSQEFYGLNVGAAYTLGKAIDEQSSFSTSHVEDAANPKLERGRSDFDARQKLSLSVIWKLPGAQLKSAPLRSIIGGWQLSDVSIFQAGTPFSVYCSTPFAPVFNQAKTAVIGNTGCDYNADGDNYDRPDAPSFGNTVKGTRKGYINGLFAISDFPAPPLGQHGNLGRNTFVGPGFANSDMTLAKHFPAPWFAGEKADVEFRAEAFNVFNRVNLTSMASDMGGANFGKATSTFGARDFQFGLRLSF